MAIRKDNLTETLVSSEKVFQGEFLNVFNDTVKLPDDKLATREWINFGKASAIIAITNDNEIILERQYRHPVKKIMIEIPAGKTEKDETAIISAKRELLEETGISAKTWIELGALHPCIGYSNEQITYFLAQDLSIDTPKLDEGEFIEVFTAPFKQCLEMIFTNQISDTKTVAGIMLYQGFLNRNRKI